MKITCLVLLFAIYSLGAFCQKAEEENKVQSWPIVIAISTHSYSWPIVKSFVTPVQPGFKIGTEYYYSKRSKYSFLQTFSLGYFKNPEFLQAIYLDSYFTYRYSSSYRMFFDGAVGAGYLHKRHTREVFRLNDNGEFKPETDWGSPAVKLGLNIGLGYNFSIKSKQLSPFVNYEWFVKYPHVKNDIPVLAHSLYHIGVRVQIFQ